MRQACLRFSVEDLRGGSHHPDMGDESSNSNRSLAVADDAPPELRFAASTPLFA